MTYVNCRSHLATDTLATGSDYLWNFQIVVFTFGSRTANGRIQPLSSDVSIMAPAGQIFIKFDIPVFRKFVSKINVLQRVVYVKTYVIYDSISLNS